VSLSLRLKDLLGAVTGVEEEKNPLEAGFLSTKVTAQFDHISNSKRSAEALGEGGRVVPQRHHHQHLYQTILFETSPRQQNLSSNTSILGDI